MGVLTSVTTGGRRTSHGPTSPAPCTWTPDCPRDGDHRVENQSMSGGSVEFVCATHVGDALAAGYNAG
jgi:hypothetical protein